MVLILRFVERARKNLGVARYKAVWTGLLSRLLWWAWLGDCTSDGCRWFLFEEAAHGSLGGLRLLEIRLKAALFANSRLTVLAINYLDSS